MARFKLAVETLLGGLALRKANEALDRIVQDVLARGDVEKPRTVQLQIQITPGWNVEGGFPTARPVVDYSIKETVPPAIGTGLVAAVGVDRDGMEILTVDVDLPENDPSQKTIFDSFRIDIVK